MASGNQYTRYRVRESLHDKIVSLWTLFLGSVDLNEVICLTDLPKLLVTFYLLDS